MFLQRIAGKMKENPILTIVICYGLACTGAGWIIMINAAYESAQELGHYGPYFFLAKFIVIVFLAIGTVVGGFYLKEVIENRNSQSGT